MICFTAPISRTQAPLVPPKIEEHYRPVIAGLSTERLAWVLLSAIFLLGLSLRVNCLDCYSLWYDEITSVETAQRGWEGIFGYRFGWVGNQTPLHYILVWLTAQFADPTEISTWVRLPSALAGALTALVVYRLGSVFFTRAHGLVAALLVALTPTLLDYSQELRPYSMLTFLTALSVLCLAEAARGGRSLWWVGFALATVLNLLNSTVALTMVLPPLGLYALYEGWKMWRARASAAQGDKESRRKLLYLALSLVAIGCAALPTLVGTLAVPRSTIEDSQLTPGDLLSLLVVVANWYTQLDGGGQVGFPLGTERWLGQTVEYVLLALATAGGFLAVRSRRDNGFAALPLLLFTLVPWVILAYFMTRYYVTPRYVLFSVPFFLLLISYALLYPVSLLRGATERTTWVGRAAAAIPLLVVALLFVVGALKYAVVDMADSLPDRPDYRAATQYLASEVRAQDEVGAEDVIIFADHNALGYTSAMFYWRNSPPVPVYDVRDPRLAGHGTSGDIFWVFGAMSPSLVDDLITDSQGQLAKATFRDVVIVREHAPSERSAATMLDNLDKMVGRLRALRPDHAPFFALEASVHQARGEVPEAVSDYYAAGEAGNKVLGNEYLRTAIGFAERGQMLEAWREANISKFMRSSNPDLHIWMAHQLAAEGKTSEAQTAQKVADGLRALGAK